MATLTVISMCISCANVGANTAAALPLPSMLSLFLCFVFLMHKSKELNESYELVHLNDDIRVLGKNLGAIIW